MNAKFSIGKVLRNDVETEVELVELSGGYMGKDAVVKEATADHRRQFKDEYNAFKNPPLTSEQQLAQKDAQIASLSKEIEEAKALLVPKAQA